MNQEFVEKLVTLGLSEKESAVYIALLEHGDMTAEQTAKLARLNRSTTYVQLAILMEIGLASTYKRGKKTFFAAESPLNLERILTHQEQLLVRQKSEATLMIPQLMKLYTSMGNRPVVRQFEGKEGLMTMRNEMLESQVTDIFVATNYDNMMDIFTVPELMAYSEKRAKKKIKSYVLYTLSEGEDITVVPPQEMKRVDHTRFPFGSEVYIYDSSVAFTSIDNKAITGVVITSPSIAATMRGIFQMTWQSLPK